MLGVDRLDYIKGIPHKLYGIQTFLEEHPEMCETTGISYLFCIL